jgi:hypothetical protein
MKTKDTSIPEQKLTVRMSQETLENLRQLAIDHKRSLNGEIEWALQFYVKNEVKKGDNPEACSANIVV